MAPDSRSPRGAGWSKPTKTVVTKSWVKPENQVSWELLVVPVLPPRSPRLSCKARLPVPDWMTCWSMLLTRKAFCSEMARVASLGASRWSLWTRRLREAGAVSVASAVSFSVGMSSVAMALPVASVMWSIK